MAGVRSELPHDLVVEIFSWLPSSSVLSLRCVCKAWNALTRDPFFLDLHRRRAVAAACESPASYIYLLDKPVVAHLSYKPTIGGTRVTRLPYLFQEESRRSCIRISLKSHCRGLTCIALLRGQEIAISVHNLTTGECRVLVTLPADADFSFHLGFDHYTNRYKLLHLEPHPRWDEAYDVGITMKPAAAKLYTLGDAPGAWRRLPDYYFPIGTFSRVTSWKGNPTWMSAPPPNYNRVQVVWFDMAREEFLTMAGPNKGMLEADEMAVQIFPWWNDALAMATYSKQRLALDFWVLTNIGYQSVWSPRWSIPLGDPNTIWDIYSKIVGPLPGEKLLLITYKGLATVGPNSPGGRLKKVKLPSGKKPRWPVVISPHVETLVSLQDLWNEGQADGN